MSNVFTGDKQSWVKEHYVYAYRLDAIDSTQGMHLKVQCKFAPLVDPNEITYNNKQVSQTLFGKKVQCQHKRMLKRNNNKNI